MLYRPSKQSLPTVRDSQSFRYVQHKRIHQDKMGLVLETDIGIEQISISNLQVLLVGPGCSITSAAIRDLADHNCTVVWMGEEGVRFYSCGLGATNSGKNAEHHARIWANPQEGQKVIQRMYSIRYGQDFPDITNMTLNEIRGHEGQRVKKAYAEQAKQQGVVWNGRSYNRGAWDATDAVNQALSATSACLYSLCHSVVLSVGFLPSLGFLHNDNARAFAIDIADMYRETVTIPIAFSLMANTVPDVNGTMARRACRDYFAKNNFLEKILKDTYFVLGVQ